MRTSEDISKMRDQLAESLTVSGEDKRIADVVLRWVLGELDDEGLALEIEKP
jgi:hypothetical protein